MSNSIYFLLVISKIKSPIYCLSPQFSPPGGGRHGFLAFFSRKLPSTSHANVQGSLFGGKI